MPYIPKPIDRDQVTINTLDSMVGWDSTARVIDHFVECLDLDKLGFEKTGPGFGGGESVLRSKKFAKALPVRIPE